MGAWVPLQRVAKKKKRLSSEMQCPIKARQEVARESNKIIKKLLNSDGEFPKTKRKG